MYKSRERLDEENRIARKVDIVFVARQMGFCLKRIGSGACQYRCEDSHLNLYPGTNSYFNYYDNRGGSPIDLLVKECDMSVSQAIKWLLDNSLETPSVPIESDLPFPTSNKTRKESDFTLPAKNSDHHRVFSYLTKTRRIAPDVVKKFFHLHTLYESADHHNCIFVGNDKDGNAKHGFIHGTLTDKSFKGDVPGSNKTYGFTYINPNSSKLLVFEAPIDLMSYMTLYPEDNANMLALGMLAPDPIYTFLSEYTNIKNIVLTLDVDKYGLDATERYLEDLSERYKDCVVTSNPICKDLRQANVKDVNALLLKIKNIEDKLMSSRGENNVCNIHNH